MNKFTTSAVSTSANVRSLIASYLSKSALGAAIAALFCLSAAMTSSVALADNVAGDFSIGSNPNGDWSYGWSSTLGSTFNLDSSNTASAYGLSGLEGWFANQSVTHEPSVVYNSTTNSIFQPSFTTYQPGQLALNLGGNYYSVVRWTAPSNGLYSVSATFSGLSAAGDSTDVHILLNNGSTFNSTVFGSPSPTS